jgi:signal transduction histidine kinase/CheY-like chemotaxis protein
MIVTISPEPSFTNKVKDLLSLLEIDVSSSFVDIKSFLEQAKDIHPNLVLVDIKIAADHQDEINLLLSSKAGSSVIIVPSDRIAEFQFEDPQRLPTLFAQLDTAINQSIHLEEALDQVNKTVSAALNVNLGSCILLPADEPEAYRLVSTNINGLMPDRSLAFLPEHFQALAHISENKKILIVPDIRLSPYENSPIVKTFGIGSGIGIPLLVQEELIGILFVFHRQPRLFSQTEIDFLYAFANRAALAIDKVQLYHSLQTAKEAAESAVRSRSDYLARMSHELRAPLAAINNLSELMSGTPLSPIQEDYLRSIKSSAARLLALLNDILEYSRLEASKLTLKAKEFNLIHVIESSLNLIAIPAAQKDIDLAYKMDVDVPETLVGDSDRLGQILTNLLTNAVKFTESGWITIEVSMRATNLPLVAWIDSEVELMFTIRDTGIGIAPDVQNTLFEPFSQTAQQKPTNDQGSGLGLSICKQLVNLMEGDIWVESSGIPGKGSAFSFTMRTKVVHSPTSPYLQRTPAPLQNKHGLVFGKPRPSLNYLLDWLEYWGVHSSFFDVSEPVPIQAQFDPDIDFLLIDERSIQPSAENFLTQTNSQETLKRHVPVLVFTAANTRINENLKGITTYLLHWPLSVPRLYNKLIDALQFTDGVSQPQIGETKIEILLVDDDLINQAAVQLHLERLGFHADIVSGGAEALKSLETKRYDLIIMDMRMGAMDGYTTTRTIREILPVDHQPIIAILTAGVTPNQLNALQSTGIDAYIEKPVSPEKLIHLFELVRREHTSTLRESDNQNIKNQINNLPKHIEAGINLDVLKKLTRMFPNKGEADSEKIFDLFLKSTPEMMEKALNASNEKNPTELRDILHALRGTCDIFGAERLSLLCRNLEHDLDMSIVDNLTARLSEIEKELTQVKSAIIKFQQFPQSLENLTE